MSVTKSARECYEIRNVGEWANITMDCWDRPANDGGRVYYCGEITIQSGFGTWGYIWTACGRPFKQFLGEISFDYAFGKFMGGALDRYDGEATVARVRRDIIEERRRGHITKAEAREAWDCVADEEERLACSRNDFGYAMWDIAGRLDREHPMRDHFSDPCGWPCVTKPDIQAVGFWRDIWPLFIDALKAETQQDHPVAA